MRVLHVYRTYFPDTQGGLEEAIRQLCFGTRPHGVESRVLTTTKQRAGPFKLELEEATVYRMPESFEVASCNVSIRAMPTFRDQVAWAEIVHYHFPWPFADLLHVLGRMSKPSLVTYHSDIVRQRLLFSLYKPLMSRFLGSVDRIVCTSPNYFATSNLLPEYEGKVEVIPIGIDQRWYPSAEESIKREVESEYGSDFFLFVGVLRYYKGLHILLEAIKGAPYKVVIVGSGPTESELKAQAAGLGLTNVQFAGYVSDEIKVALFSLSKGIVFPSYLRSEAFGITLLEGAMFGKPLISTEVGSGTSHVNIHRQTGLVIAPGSPRALRSAMDEIFKHPDLATQWGRKARKRFEEFFESSLMSRRYANLYQRLTSNNTGPASDPQW